MSSISKIVKKTQGKIDCIKSCFKTKNVREEYIDIQESEFWEIYELCKPYTMTSIERMYALYNSVLYVLDNNIEGAFVECGVWRGGSSLIIARILFNRSIERDLILYDTFSGMSEPTAEDVNLKGVEADLLLEIGKNDKENSVWCLANEVDVLNNLKLSGYNMNKVRLVKGMVEDTIPQQTKETEIALLRLDTDWYESTKHELIHLYPKLSKNGVLIIDDYGHWKGCRTAVDEYFKSNNIKMLLNRIDYTGRSGIKQ